MLTIDECFNEYPINFSLIDRSIEKILHKNIPVIETATSTVLTTKQDCGNYCEEDDALSYIVGAVCGAVEVDSGTTVSSDPGSDALDTNNGCTVSGGGVG